MRLIWTHQRPHAGSINDRCACARASLQRVRRAQWREVCGREPNGRVGSLARDGQLLNAWLLRDDAWLLRQGAWLLRGDDDEFRAGRSWIVPSSVVFPIHRRIGNTEGRYIR